MRKVPILPCVAAAGFLLCLAAEAAALRPTKIVVHSGDVTVPVQIGDTPLDKPVTFNCKKVGGCIVTIATFGTMGDSDVAICALVDGQDAEPICEADNNASFWSSHQHAKIATGSHSLSAIVRSGKATNVRHWEGEYVLYD